MSQAQAVGAHLEDASHNCSLLSVNLGAYTDDSGATVLRYFAGVFDGDVPVSVTASTGNKALKNTTFLSAVYFVGDSNDVLLVDHRVQREQLARGFLARIYPLTDGHHRYVVELENSDCTKCVFCVTREPGCIVDQQNVEGTRLLLGRVDQSLETIAPPGRCAAQRAVKPHEFFDNVVRVLLGHEGATLTNLVVNRSGSLHVG